MRAIDNIVLHCSASEFGDAGLIDEWHKERGWIKIGYHFVLTNGKRKAGDIYEERNDGAIEKGRRIEEVGAHVLGLNAKSVGICMIGNRHFTWKQFSALGELVGELMSKYKSAVVIGHGETDSGKAQGKTCPNFDVHDFVCKVV